MLIQVAAELSMPDQPGACIIAGITVAQEAGSDPYLTGQTQFWCPANPTGDAETTAFEHDSTSNDSASSGYFQQQPPWWGTAAQRMSLHDSATLFMTSLKRYPYTASGPVNANAWAQKVQDSDEPDAYGPHYDDITALYTAVTGDTPQPQEQTVPTAVANQNDPRLAVLAGARPDFNEFANSCSNNEPRNGTPVDLWLVHTEESSGYDDALGLSNFLISTEGGDNPVSYHYTISKGEVDDGVTVVDCVDTDAACWAVGNSNDRSINLCFAGSSVAWSRAEWIANLGRCLDVAAYLCVQDAIKYGSDPTRITFGAPNVTGYDLDPPCVSDHRYCTDYLKDGNTHVDVGDNFPADLLTASIQKYWATANATGPAPAPTPQPTPVSPAPTPPAAPVAPAQAAPGSPEQMQEIWDQLRILWPQLGNQTIVNALGQVRDTILGVNDYANWKVTQ